MKLPMHWPILGDRFSETKEIDGKFLKIFDEKLQNMIVATKRNIF